MTRLLWIVPAFLLLAAQDDSIKQVHEFVEQLGSEKVEDREAGVEKLLSMNREILPLLRREMSIARDKEVRGRIADVIERMAWCAVFAPELPTSSAEALKTSLAGSNNTAHVVAFDNLAKALASKAELLVLYLHRGGPRPSDKELQALKSRRVIGIGYRAAEMFGTMELEIQAGACAHNTESVAPKITLEKSELLGEANQQVSLVAFRLPRASKGLDPHFSVHIPRKSHVCKVVDVIARNADSPNYAPIVRQGNHVLIGLAAPPDTWTPEFSKLFQELAAALISRKLEPFARAKWEVTRPGTYTFELAQGRSTEELSGRKFYFKFSKPTAFSATFKHKGSNEVMLILYGDGGDRKDAEKGEPLEIVAEITERDIRRVGEGYWELGVANFDVLHKAECTLTIDYKE